ncbi:MAG: hypothetical protein Q7S88_01295 [Candidatus Daviesbacteria bacterium]|nr:hypothetical protein [Candidatus Daviesbacteria bacterium]
MVKYFIILLVIIVGVGGFFGFQKLKENSLNNHSQENFQAFDNKQVSGKSNPFNQRYSRGKCQGEGTVKFTHLPMKIEDIGQVEPYGIMVDAHVIPTSHGYISPINFQSERDAYPVYAIADGFIVNVSHRGENVGDTKTDRVTDEYQMYFEHSCTFYTYYDLLTSLSPKLQAEVGKLTGFEQKQVRIPIKAGELVGRIGGQTVDFAVWNFAKEPAYFANPKSYEQEGDRPYLDDMFAYFEEPLKSQLLAKNRRTVEPRSGRVAYDIEGKLVGNWFREGSGGFSGPKDIQKTSGGRYWDGHLSISYDYIDPSKIIFSIGNFNGKAAQFNIKGNSPDPATIGVEQGLIKYELQSVSHGQEIMGPVQGTVLLQLIETSKLKVETFPGKSAGQVSGFTSKALIFER